MKIKDITEWSERWSNLILGLAPGKQPDDNPDYQNHQEYSGPNSGLEDIADHLTASQGYSRNKQKYEEIHWHPPFAVGTLTFYSSKGCLPGNPVPKLSFSLPLCNHGRKLREVMDAEIVIQ